MKSSTLWIALFCLLLSASGPPSASGAELGLSSAFTYSGRLDDGGRPAQGTFDFTFRLWDSRSGGELLGTLDRFERPVQRGVFVEDLDFGPALHAIEQAWLEIQVRGADDAEYTTLTPRQKVGGGTTCVVDGDAIIEGRLAVGTDDFSIDAAGRVDGSLSSPDGTTGAFVVSNSLAYLMMDADDIDSWTPLGSVGIPLHLNGHAQAGVSIMTRNNHATLHVGGDSDAEPGFGGDVLIGEIAGKNLVLDRNEIMARNAGSVSPLYINHDGGDVFFQTGALGVPKVTMEGDLIVGGKIDLIIQEYEATGCSSGTLETVACSVDTVVVGGGCSTTAGRDLQTSSRSYQKWRCRWTGCGEASQHRAYVICLGIR